MTPSLAMFPGQGSQYVGMGKQLLAEFPYVSTVFEEAEDATSCKIRKLCFDGPEADLVLTANTQPAILTVSMAVWQVLMRESDWRPQAFAGHSLGEYSALVAAGVLAFNRAALLVRRRGEAMQQAVPEGVGAMAAILNGPNEELEQICRDLSRDDGSVEAVNFNAPGQVVVAGHKKAVDRLCQIAEEKGWRAVPLQVSAPFHSRLMQPAKEQMRPLLEESSYCPSGAAIIANLTGKVEAAYRAGLLVDQIDHPVLWVQSMKTAHEHLKLERYVEVGPGKVLFGLARRCLPRGLKLLHTESLPSALEELRS